MKKIVYVPLDERPCNYHFPAALAKGTEFNIVQPDIVLMGQKKTPGNVAGLWNWLLEEIKDADGAIVSLDTLLYGGIIPSRLHSLTKEEGVERLANLKKIREINPDIKLFAFQLIMRCPQYSSSDEEPDYYEDWGTEIFQKGYIKHRLELGIATEEEISRLEKVEAKLPAHFLEDYLSRRKVNLAVNQAAVDYVKDQTIDFMIIPQDDSAPYGLTALDQQTLRESISTLGTELNVYMYPGADEVGCTLLARMINHFNGNRPLLYPHFSSIKGPYVIPKYEDRPLYESLKYQILAAGGLLATSIRDADIVLLVNTPGATMVEAISQKDTPVSYNVERNIVELTEYADYVTRTLMKSCVVADIAYANGGDLSLLKLLKEKGLLFELAGYAGWNTSSNTLGTCIAQGMIYQQYGKQKGHLDFLSLRYVEDGGYCGHVRAYVTQQVLPERGFNYFQVDGQKGEVADIVKEQLEQFIHDHLQDDTYQVIIDDCYMPWSRMFEVGLKTHVQAKTTN
ncbi:DUF4127 family protein [Neobacillus niacini]|uniref:DUF4127 family protein n=1 Tax=Neobacillus niacini TaxID=86668 RepID=UPI0005ED90DE|nr:DUF4127 family protein [Neobacillus niacini]